MKSQLNQTYRRKILSNGMTLIFEKRNVPVVSIAFAVRVGGINERLEEKGISHFIEHMLYKGTSTRSPRELAEAIEKNGGEMNGFTSEEITAFWCKMPSESLNLGLEVLSDMVQNPLFDSTELEKERKVIFEEIKMYKDNPRLHVFDEIHRCLFEKPFGVPLIGTFESMGSLDREKLVERFKETYTPENMILCVVGDTDFSTLKKFAERTFKSVKSKVLKIPIKPKNESKVEERIGLDQANFVFSYHTALAKDKKSYAAFLLNVLMAGGMSSRLFAEIREKRNLAYAVKGDATVSNYYAYNSIYVGTEKKNLDLIKDLILKEFKKVAESLQKEELDKVKKQVIGNYKISMEESQVQMMNLLSNEIQGDAGDFYKFEERISKVSVTDVKELASNAFKSYSTYALVPKE